MSEEASCSTGAVSFFAAEMCRRISSQHLLRLAIVEPMRLSCCTHCQTDNDLNVERPTSATVPKSLMMSPLHSITSLCKLSLKRRLVSVEFFTPLLSRVSSASRISGSVYEVDRTLVSLLDRALDLGAVALAGESGEGTGQDALSNSTNGDTTLCWR